MEKMELHSQDAHTKQDDLRQIQGIGPAIEKRLKRAGLDTYAKIAAQTPEQLAQILNDVPGHSADQIASKRWVEQASELAEQAGEPTEAEMEAGGATPPASGRQHYEVFTVELLVDEDNQVRRTRAKHVQSQQESAWSGLQSEPLLAFISDQAKIGQAQEHPAEDVMDQPEEALSPAHETKKPAQPAAQQEGGANGKAAAQEQKRPARQSPVTEIHLLEGESSIRSLEPFHVQLQINMPETGAARDIPARYETEIYAKQFGGGKTQLVGKAHGQVTMGNPVQIDVSTIGMPQGLYRLEALVFIFPEKALAGSPPVIRAMSESNLFYIR